VEARVGITSSMKKRPPFNQNAAIRSAIRRVFSRSPVVREVMWKVRRQVPKYNKDGTKAKKDAVQYCCNVCQQWTKSTLIAVDHKIPVIDVENGFVDWNEFVTRLFCDASNLQVICDACHNTKTNAERFERQLRRDRIMLSELKTKLFAGNIELVKKSIAKFTKKRLLHYPHDVNEDVAALRSWIDSIKPSRKISKRRSHAS
jgi:5-methylcytosine-specific restriction endonuclease McrA